jgi:transposase
MSSGFHLIPARCSALVRLRFPLGDCMLAVFQEASMEVDWKDPSDAQRLRELVRDMPDAKQRDRYRVVLLAGFGLGERNELKRDEIAAAVGRSRQFVDEWVGRYRRGGIEALIPKRQPGAAPKLSAAEQQELCGWLDAGPDPDEGISAYNGPLLRQLIHDRFGKLMSLSGVYGMLHRLGYNDLMPRTTHPDTDPAELEAFKKKNCPSVWLSSKHPTPTSVY